MDPADSDPYSGTRLALGGPAFWNGPRRRHSPPPPKPRVIRTGGIFLSPAARSPVTPLTGPSPPQRAPQPWRKGNPWQQLHDSSPEPCGMTPRFSMPQPRRTRSRRKQRDFSPEPPPGMTPEESFFRFLGHRGPWPPSTSASPLPAAEGGRPSSRQHRRESPREQSGITPRRRSPQPPDSTQPSPLHTQSPGSGHKNQLSEKHFVK
ncbi:serine/arginine-rich splicing factor SR45-like [Archocentrus centrarchus]|uniref:serine/arginine-rich splicing factor SR45-like n=1 Tax=Archocentrus centrarchus TaxID=63155 RepID=UPI0011E9C2E2|nr:serine/arginine-rich splicing factor SR45-like [Archocentrus centrarchus]